MNLLYGRRVLNVIQEDQAEKPLLTREVTIKVKNSLDNYTISMNRLECTTMEAIIVLKCLAKKRVKTHHLSRDGGHGDHVVLKE